VHVRSIEIEPVEEHFIADRLGISGDQFTQAIRCVGIEKRSFSLERIQDQRSQV